VKGTKGSVPSQPTSCKELLTLQPKAAPGDAAFESECPAFWPKGQRYAWDRDLLCAKCRTVESEKLSPGEYTLPSEVTARWSGLSKRQVVGFRLEFDEPAPKPRKCWETRRQTSGDAEELRS
jgi:hypothetical protein